MLFVERRLRACEPGRDRASVSQTSDEILFERHRQGDPTAMRTLIERHQADLMRFLTRLTGETAGAEDVFQDAFLQAHVAAHTFDAERRFRP